jgi:hypothetical protein
MPKNNQPETKQVRNADALVTPPRLAGAGIFGTEKLEMECNVVCVSRHGIGRAFEWLGDYGTAWHDPISGPLKVRVVLSGGELHGKGFGVPVTEVIFQGKVLPVLYHRTGLSGTSQTLGVLNPEDPIHPVWDLYSDVPVPGCDRVSDPPKRSRW